MTENSVATSDTTAPDTSLTSYVRTDYFAQAAAKARKKRIRNWTIGVVVVILAIAGALWAMAAIDKDNKLEASQIAAIKKFGDDNGWMHTGRWYIDPVNTASGQVSLGTCVYNVSTQADQPTELRVSLPESAYTNDTKRPDFRPFLVNKLTAAAAQADKWRLNVSHCFPASNS